MEKKFVVVLRNNGSDKKWLSNELKKQKNFSAAEVKALLQDAIKPQAISYHASQQEAEQMKARLEKCGAVITVEPVFQVEAWLSFDFSKSSLTVDEMLGIELPVIARSFTDQIFMGKGSLFSLADQVQRGVDCPELDEYTLLYLYSSLDLQNGQRVFVSYTVHSTPLPSREYGAFTNGYAIYYRDMPYLLIAPTTEDCLAGNFVQATWENTIQKELTVPVGGELIKMENPFRTVVVSGNGTPGAARFCPNCGAPVASNDKFCGKCGCKL